MAEQPRVRISRFNRKYPFTSFLNYSLVRLSYRLNRNKVWGYPSKILIEPTSHCNLRCPLCPRGMDALNRDDGLLSFEHFKQIVDEIKPYTPYLELAGYGEPFINKDICKMVRYASDAGIFIKLYSNALVIDTPEKVSELVQSGARLLNLSIDGATQATYEKYRVGGELSLALANMKAIVQEKKRQRVAYPIVQCQVVVTKENEHEVEDVKRIATEIGVDRFSAKTANLSLTRPVGDNEISKTIVKRWFPQTAALRRHKEAKEQTYENGCDWLYKRAFIYWNGDVTTCCYDGSGTNKMGNVFEAGSFYKVWNGVNYQNLRRQVNQDIRQAKPLCSVCPERAIVKQS